jgi:hypothetical protein
MPANSVFAALVGQIALTDEQKRQLLIMGRQMGKTCMVAKEVEDALSLIEIMLNERADLTDEQRRLMLSKALTDNTYGPLVEELSFLSEDTRLLIREEARHIRSKKDE